MDEHSATPERRWIARAGLWANYQFTHYYHRLKVLSPCRIPATGPAILVCNHTSGLDPALLQSACPRLIAWMMAREYHDLRGLGWVYRHVGAIPVERRGRDLAATRAALRALAAGRIVGVFPEGRIETDRHLLPFQVGVALLAIKSGAPVFPAWLDGTQRKAEMLQAYLHPQRAVVNFGPAVEFDRSSTNRPLLEAATEGICRAITALADSATEAIAR